MIIAPKFSLKLVEYHGAKIVLDAEAVRKLSVKYPDIKATTLRKGRSMRECEKPSTCISIPVSEYMKGVNHASNPAVLANS